MLNMRDRVLPQILPVSQFLLAFGVEVLRRRVDPNPRRACQPSLAQAALEAALVVVRRQRCLSCSSN